MAPKKKAVKKAPSVGLRGKKSTSERLVDALYKAALRYVEFYQGTIIVASGIEIQQWPGEPAGQFALAIRCLGRRPAFPALPEVVKRRGEEIPARVMGSLKVARECGLEKFRVAFPVLENEPQKDPVLLAKLGGKYLEIDMWE